MGYYTRYKIKAIDTKPGDNRPVLDDKFFNSLNLCGYDPEDEVWQENGDERFMIDNEIKWYDHSNDLTEASKKHPTIVFILDGEGEESGDIWRKFYLNGKVHEWRPTIEPPEWDDELASVMCVVDEDFG